MTMSQPKTEPLDAPARVAEIYTPAERAIRDQLDKALVDAFDPKPKLVEMFELVDRAETRATSSVFRASVLNGSIPDGIVRDLIVWARLRYFMERCLGKEEQLAELFRAHTHKKKMNKP